MLRVAVNNHIYFDDYVKENITIDCTVSIAKHNQLTINHYGKQFGENGVWDTKVANDVITHDRAIKINAIELNDVDIAKYIVNHWPFTASDGTTLYTDYIGHNGLLTIDFDAPVYDWIIQKLVKPTTVLTAATVVETSHSDLFNYTNDLKELNAIENLLKEYAHLFN